MTDQAKLPESGYFIERVYANRLGLTVARPAKNGENVELYFRWDWKLLGDALFEVNVGLLIEPTETRSEQVEVSIIGVFRQSSHQTEVALDDFVRYHAPAILMPYVREAVSSLTGRGYYSSKHLPPFNVQQLMDRQDPSLATGAKQLVETSRTATQPATTRHGERRGKAKPPDRDPTL